MTAFAPLVLPSSLMFSETAWLRDGNGEGWAADEVHHAPLSQSPNRALIKRRVSDGLTLVELASGRLAEDALDILGCKELRNRHRTGQRSDKAIRLRLVVPKRAE